ncbi:hypothetical protein ACA876_004132 [Vibrio vulnificus]|nr:hypothetical protein [Vibrio vulnificus]ELM6618678.1 hypothetical protein [Vibrio vulnificus]ELP3505702.1 hypothetical protein [Vibrio vulnificus]ELP3554540.1 hypothetical protein [Vibrio vulnificus]ELP7003297.1 hypothetical protein [Vibrio vulnificus]
MKKKYVRLGVAVASMIIVPYLYFMFVHPWIVSGFSWNYVHSVWYTWQSLNVGMLAFTSSIIALIVVTYREEKQRQRDFIAARAFLPLALDELCKYMDKTKLIIKHVGFREANVKGHDAIDIPMLPESYAGIFKDCIRYANPEVNDYLAKILMLLQIHHARMGALPSSKTSASFKALLYKQTQLHLLINHLFDFARGECEFTEFELTWERFENAYYSYGIDSEYIEDLEGYTKRAIAREKNT